ncbi:hypothetical protein NPIL_38921 [Nephila pilipes]|uniref:Uncharacterized protein n=1 Tax=Nephila pilipes TaxID=299642 RepID=A0A8X6PNS4_NEPPI|nr:hypothetical protein NPIL_38921 [Nephila pilipes]
MAEREETEKMEGLSERAGFVEVRRWERNKQKGSGELKNYYEDLRDFQFFLEEADCHYLGAWTIDRRKRARISIHSVTMATTNAFSLTGSFRKDERPSINVRIVQRGKSGQRAQ